MTFRSMKSSFFNSLCALFLSPRGIDVVKIQRSRRRSTPWVQAMPEEDRQKLIAIDGKRLRGASSNGKIHLVSAWDSIRSLLLGQVKTEEKSNEITAIPAVLDSIIRHCLPLSNDCLQLPENSPDVVVLFLQMHFYLHYYR